MPGPQESANDVDCLTWVLLRLSFLVLAGGRDAVAVSSCQMRETASTSLFDIHLAKPIGSFDHMAKPMRGVGGLHARGGCCAIATLRHRERGGSFACRTRLPFLTKLHRARKNTH